jgi:endonuclease YncB( thermonuclease family)
VAKDAAKFTLSLLRARPFRIVTRWEKEAGDDAFLCFVYLDNGEGGWQNLSSWLVRSGLAMIVPCERDLPEPKVSAAEYQKQLETDEAEAKHSRTGAWAR